MCGICGYINLSKSRHDISILRNMVNTLHHRGPDSQGCFEDQEHQIFLGHARLSIIDISDNGRQPMSLDNLTIVFNGEIYNYQEIKKELCNAGHSFKTSSDTEVILHSYQEWGVECVNRFIGMFAFSIYDSEAQTLALFRDRAGVKPLYYYFDGNAFIFGSELKAFHQNPLFHKELDFDALGYYMKFGYIPTPHCVFKKTYKLQQASYIVLDIRKASYDIYQYWNLKSFYTRPKLRISYEEALEETERIMTSAFNYRMVSDVPVGVFLSAGFDSTCVAALLQKGMSDKLRTFTIGFESGNNEAPMAKKIADYLGTNHSEHYCSEEDALGIIEDLPYYYDEPFADSSAIPTTLVSRIAREQVKVALSADGGDEIFAGYTRYDFYNRCWCIFNKVPHVLKTTIGALANKAKSISSPKLRYKFSIASQVLLSDKDVSSSLLKALDKKDYAYYPGDIFTRPVSFGESVYNENNDDMTFLSRLLYADYVQYMPDDILVKVDRAAMSTSLEGRNPFLDHRIIEFAAQLPDNYKYADGVKKKILKDIVYKYVPKELLDKPKTGFSVPLSCWLKNDLKDLVGNYLSEDLVKAYGLFDYSFVKFAKEKIQDLNESSARELWKIVQLQMWYEKWMCN